MLAKLLKALVQRSFKALEKVISNFVSKCLKRSAKLLDLRSRMFNDFSEALDSSFYCSVLCPMKLLS